MHSVDLAVKCPIYDHTKDSGFIATIAKDNNLFYTPPQSTLCGKHEFYLGKYLPQVIDEIGGDIDFVILDTVHFMPGEILDFIAVMPYLKEGALVVLHDVADNHYERPNWINAYCTGVLFSVVTAEKFLNFIPKGCGNTFFRYPNIAAFKINEHTRANIDQLFLSLVINWNYSPKPAELKFYLTHYRRHYPKQLVDIFVEMIRMNLCNIIMTPYI